MVRTGQGNKRTQSLVRSYFIRIVKFCSTTRFCLSHRGLEVWVQGTLVVTWTFKASSTRLYYPVSLRMRTSSSECTSLRTP